VGFSYSFISFILGSVLFLYESLVGYYIYIFVWLSRKHFFCCHVHWMGISSSIFHLPSSLFFFFFRVFLNQGLLIALYLSSDPDQIIYV
jgi:hypothetical protein